MFSRYPPRYPPRPIGAPLPDRYLPPSGNSINGRYPQPPSRERYPPPRAPYPVGDRYDDRYDDRFPGAYNRDHRYRHPNRYDDRFRRPTDRYPEDDHYDDR